jgi:hypothetical protein
MRVMLPRTEATLTRADRHLLFPTKPHALAT